MLNKIQVQQLSVEYISQYNALSDIWKTQIEFIKGKQYFIQAPSGKGKSSFLHLLYGTRTLYEGSIFFDNQNIRSFTLEDWSKYRSKNISILFQDLRLFADLTVYENLFLKFSQNSDLKWLQIEDWLEKIGLASKLHTKSQNLSYGERQRIAFIKSLIQPFSFLLLDEPFSHLDDKNIQILLQILAERVQSLQSSVIFVDLENLNWDLFDFKLYI